MRRSAQTAEIGRLPLDQPTCLQALQHRVQQESPRPARDEAGAELRQHADVEPGIGQTEKRRIRVELERRLQAASGDGVPSLIVRYGDFLVLSLAAIGSTSW